MTLFLQACDDGPHIIGSALAGKAHHGIFDGERITDLTEGEALFFGSGLYVDIAEVEDGRDEAIDRSSDILDAREAELAYTAREEPLLFDVDDAFVRDNPDVEVVIDPNEEAIEPDEEENGVLDKKEEWPILFGQGFRKEYGQGHDAADQEKGEQEYHQEMDGDVEPVPMDDAKHQLVFVLSLKVVAAKWRGRRHSLLER